MSHTKQRLILWRRSLRSAFIQCVVCSQGAGQHLLWTPSRQPAWWAPNTFHQHLREPQWRCGGFHGRLPHEGHEWQRDGRKIHFVYLWSTIYIWFFMSTCTHSHIDDLLCSRCVCCILSLFPPVLRRFPPMGFPSPLQPFPSSLYPCWEACRDWGVVCVLGEG